MGDKNHPLITVITVVLNGAETLEAAFESVFSQSIVDYEYLVIDGGSADGSVDIIRKYEKKIDYWISEPDNGVYDAMNKAVKLAKGKWVYFLGSDDVLLDSLGEMSGRLLSEDTIYYGDVFRPSLKREYDGRFSAYKLASRNICQQAMFYPKKVFSKYTFNLRYKVLADYELNMRCYADPALCFLYIPMTIATFNDNGGLSNIWKDVYFQLDKLRLIRRYFPYYVYVISVIRSFILKGLTVLKIDKIAVSVYHLYLRILRTLI